MSHVDGINAVFKCLFSLHVKLWVLLVSRLPSLSIAASTESVSRMEGTAIREAAPEDQSGYLLGGGWSTHWLQLSPSPLALSSKRHSLVIDTVWCTVCVACGQKMRIAKVNLRRKMLVRHGAALTLQVSRCVHVCPSGWSCILSVHLPRHRIFT